MRRYVQCPMPARDGTCLDLTHRRRCLWCSRWRPRELCGADKTDGLGTRTRRCGGVGAASAAHCGLPAYWRRRLPLAGEVMAEARLPRLPRGLRSLRGVRGLRVRDLTATAATGRAGCPSAPCSSASVAATACATWAGRLDTRSGMGIGAVGEVGDGGTELSASTIRCPRQEAAPQTHTHTHTHSHLSVAIQSTPCPCRDAAPLRTSIEPIKPPLSTALPSTDRGAGR